MTDAELILKIAEYLNLVIGPYKVEGHWRNVEDGTMTEITVPDFVNDPAMTMMLMKKLECYQLTHSEGNFFIETPEPPDNLIASRSADLGRAVAEAFARAKGLLPVDKPSEER